MNAAVFEHLTQVAKSGKTTSYADVAALAGLRSDMDGFSGHLAKIFEEIAEADVKAGRSLLVVVVVRSDTSMPGKGLFKWAKANGIQGDADDVTFFVDQLRRVYDFWPTAK